MPLSDDDDDFMFEGGGKRKNRRDEKNEEEQEHDRDEAAKKVKNLFSKQDPLGHTHLKDVGDEMQKHGSKEKTGFMEKEAEFVKNLKQVQNYHLDTCILLLKIACLILGFQCIFAMVYVIYFQCGIFGSCDENDQTKGKPGTVCKANGLICYIHYIKFGQTIFLMNTYSGNIKERQPNHPIG